MSDQIQYRQKLVSERRRALNANVHVKPPVATYAEVRAEEYRHPGVEHAGTVVPQVATAPIVMVGNIAHVKTL